MRRSVFGKDDSDRIRHYSQEEMIRQEIIQAAQASGSEGLNLWEWGKKEWT